MPNPISDSNPYITAGYDRLKRLHQRVQCSNWQEKIQRLSKSSESSNPLENRTLVKGLCDEIAQHARLLNDDLTCKMLFEFLSCIGHSSHEMTQRLSEIQGMKDRTKKHQALLQLLLSQELQHILAEQLKFYLSNGASDSFGNTQKKKNLDNVLGQGIARLMDYISVASNQDSYSPTGRIVKSLIDLLTMLFDIFLVNLGLKPAFTSDAENDSGHKPENIINNRLLTHQKICN